MLSVSLNVMISYVILLQPRCIKNFHSRLEEQQLVEIVIERVKNNYSSKNGSNSARLKKSPNHEFSSKETLSVVKIYIVECIYL